jgi:hypothetical protein
MGECRGAQIGKIGRMHDGANGRIHWSASAAAIMPARA